ncbi:MAG: endonuclease/exonuclease/phosphatase family protein [Phycisphaerales bacterium]|nr:endonuclease/exonuclease/phosphatase family protein [Phycisphaerales bacterium]
MTRTTRTTQPLRALSAMLLAIACFAFLVSCDTPRTPPQTDQPRTHTAPEAPDLSIMSFNIRYGTADDGPDRWEARRRLLFDVIASHNPDIAGLQEALRFQLDEIRAALPQYAEVGVGRDDGAAKGEYAAILYRSDRFDLADSGTFWFSDTPDVPGSKHWGNSITRICSWARLLERSPGSPARGLYIFNLHLDHQSEPSRQRSAELLAARVLARAHPEDPVIITGDFNCGEQSPAIRFLTGRSRATAQDSAASPPAGWPGLLDTFRAAHPADPEPATFTAFKPGTPRDGPKIDYILISPAAFTVIDAAIDRTTLDGRLPSDHYPVTAHLRYPGTQP